MSKTIAKEDAEYERRCCKDTSAGDCGRANGPRPARVSHLSPMVGFLLNVLCLSLVFALIGSVLWLLVCKLLRITPWSTSAGTLFIISAAGIFIIIRDYRRILLDRINKIRAGTKFRKAVG